MTGRGSRVERQRQQPSSPPVWSSSGCYRLQAALHRGACSMLSSAWLIQEVDAGHLSAPLLWEVQYLTVGLCMCTVLYVRTYVACHDVYYQLSLSVIICHYLSLSVMIIDLSIWQSLVPRDTNPNRVMYSPPQMMLHYTYIYIRMYIITHTTLTYVQYMYCIVCMHIIYIWYI